MCDSFKITQENFFSLLRNIDSVKIVGCADLEICPNNDFTVHLTFFPTDIVNPCPKCRFDCQGNCTTTEPTCLGNNPKNKEAGTVSKKKDTNARPAQKETAAHLRKESNSATEKKDIAAPKTK